MNTDKYILLLRYMVLRGWPSNRSNLPTALLPYWTYKDELACYNGVIIIGDRVVITSSLVSQVLKDIHRDHLGIEKPRLRVRKCVRDLSPRNTPITLNPHIITQCNVCIFEYIGVNYLIVVYYFSSYPWICSLKNITTKSTIGAPKTIFTEFG